MQSSDTLYIRNMVCDRCIEAVIELLATEPVQVLGVSLGEAEIIPDKSFSRSDFAQKLHAKGFELLLNREERLIEQIKIAVNKLVQQPNQTHLSNSAYLSQEIGKSYSTISKAFSRNEGITLEKFIIQYRIEKAKELLHYDELTASEIAFKLGYSSLQHLSRQFRTITGMSISEYRDQVPNDRKPLDKLGGNSGE